MGIWGHGTARRCLTLGACAAVLVGTLAHPVALAQSLRERIQERRAERGAERAAERTPGAARWQEYTLEHGQRQRRYLLYVPPRLASGGPLPLVLAFHGGGGHAEHMAQDDHYGLLSMAEREGFAMAFPNGTSRFPGGKLATWNAGGCCGDARDRGVDDVGFARAVVADVQRRRAIDPQRIFATGMSNGGMMSHRLACDAADLFRAVASVAGTDATTTCQPSRAVAVLHIHAKDDTHVQYTGGAGADAFRDARKVMDFVSVPDTIARWVARNQCNPTAQRVLEQPGAVCEVHRGCREQAQVQLCTTETGGHSWPGAATIRPAKTAPSQALDASRVIGAFFTQATPRVEHAHKVPLQALR